MCKKISNLVSSATETASSFRIGPWRRDRVTRIYVMACVCALMPALSVCECGIAQLIIDLSSSACGAPSLRSPVRCSISSHFSEIFDTTEHNVRSEVLCISVPSAVTAIDPFFLANYAFVSCPFDIVVPFIQMCMCVSVFVCSRPSVCEFSSLDFSLILFDWPTTGFSHLLNS